MTGRLTGWLAGWRPALRIAWRDALRHRGRSLLVVVMIALPVLAVGAAAIIIRTAEVSGLEGADRTLGAADARVRTEGRGELVQAPEPGDGMWSWVSEPEVDDPLTVDDLRPVLGDDARFLPISTGWGRARLGDRVIDFSTTGVDLSDPLARGLFELERGRLPAASGEVVVNHALLDKGFEVGDDLEVDGTTLTVVGLGRDATAREYPTLLGRPADLPSPGDNVREWLVDAGPVPWSEVREVNAMGGLVTSRAVLADPPDVVSIAEQMGYDTGADEAYAVVALIVVMALIEVVLLAGPAFAVGARRHARTLALIAASGGTPAQSRRVILASGVVLGLAASAVGLVLGIVAAWLLLPLVQRFQPEWFGPFELPWLHLLPIVAFGVVSAVLASVVPAYLASRQDVVAVLAGRRGDRRPRRSTPVVGLVLLGVGVAASTYGAFTSDNDSGAFWIAGAAIVSVLGMILVVPIVVSAVARLGARLPLTARYAARDAARHRTRTVPAVAAVAATVAGVVALGIASTSQELANERNYTPRAPLGTGTLDWAPEVLPGEDAPDAAVAFGRIEEAIARVAPEVEVHPLRGPDDTYDPDGWTSTYIETPGGDEGLDWQVATYGQPLTVADDSAELGAEPSVARLVDDALAAGRVVVLTRSTDGRVDVTLRQETYTEDGEEPEARTSRRLEAQLVPWGAGPAPAAAVLPTAVADDLGVEVVITSLRLTGDLDEDTATRIQESTAGATEGAYLYVERGYQRPADALIVLLVLGGLGAVLMLGGTLTATFLALSDARPDLATLSAIGAAPRTRRRVAASYALVIGFVGALLGAAVGFIPGVAISRPLTMVGGAYMIDEAGSPIDVESHLAIPWLLIAAVVIALPLLTAAVVGATARGRLPLAARLD